MGKIKTIGLPKIYKEKGEIRAFLPSFVAKLKDYDVELFLEQDYGQGMDIDNETYLEAHDKIKFVSNREVYEQDMVIVLKAPNMDQMDWLKPGAGLMAMLHYESRPKVVEKLQKNKINSYSMDTIADDEHRRMVVSYELTALAGVKTAFLEMAKRREDFFSRERGPLMVTILGMGNLGVHAGKSSFILGDNGFEEQFRTENIPGVVVQYLEKDIVKNQDALKAVFKETDLLIDATRRADYSQYIITNEVVGCLKENCIILDLSADPYDTTVKPIQVKAIEGIPYGTIDKFVFETDASEYEKIPQEVSTKNRRVSVSCNGWPAVMTKESMQIYGEQLLPFIKILLKKGYDINPSSEDRYERALYHSTLPCFMEQQKQ